jgi:hypothetical protein
MQQPPEPPPQFAAYPRASASLYGASDKLRALAKGYFGLNKVFLVNIVLVFGLRAAGASVSTVETAILFLIGEVLLLGLVVGFATYPFNKSIGYGANWGPGIAVLTSFLMAINSALCCGIIGYVVVQQIASKEMSKYGLKPAFFGGIKKHEVEAVISALQAQERGTYTGEPPPMYPRPPM